MTGRLRTVKSTPQEAHHSTSKVKPKPALRVKPRPEELIIDYENPDPLHGL